MGLMVLLYRSTCGFQLPLPKHMTERAICNAIAPHKDVDGFNIVNVGRFCLDMNTLIPCTPLGVQELIKRTGLYSIKKNTVQKIREKTKYATLKTF
jgi:methylenetetrahydrofolate dehydrogenase(NAD+)/5,10-methenyltetrahydrofolate cyclohydrolase